MRSIQAGHIKSHFLLMPALAGDTMWFMTICSGLSMCARGHYFRRDDIGYNVFCFATKEHAEIFRDKFYGEWFERKNER